VKEQTNVINLRLDKWLWCARFFKTRAMATKAILGGRFQLNGEAMSKPHRQAKYGQVLTFFQGDEVRTVRVMLLSMRRGPAGEAALLFDDLAPNLSPSHQPRSEPSPAFEDRGVGCGRPTKRQRRETDKLKISILETEDYIC
jgi:ribosome-associated heat shock protein Hsp15